ncbi:MAG: Qat anti-phage system associated protein QatB [Candidatus Eremiobacterota bacterium]
MGTSSSFQGPNDKSPLLPPWAYPDINDEDIKDIKGIGDNKNVIPDNKQMPDIDTPTLSNWSSAKRSMSSYSKSGNYNKLKKAGQDYIRACGGKVGATKTAISGRKTAIKLGGFLSNIANKGIRETFKQFFIQELIGQSIEAVISGIADKIAPAGNTREESAARKAVLTALGYLYEKYKLEEGNIEKLNSISKDDIRDVFECYINSYIYTRWLGDLGSRMEIHSISEDKAIWLEKEVKKYVISSVHSDFKDYDLINLDWNKAEDIIEKIYQDAYATLEVV